MFVNKLFAYFCIVYSAILDSSKSSFVRNKRFLIFPPTAPTRAQLIYGIGIPLDLEHQSVTTGYVLKAQYFLPTKASEILPDLFPVTYINNKRSVTANLTDIETKKNFDNINSNSKDSPIWFEARWIIYRGIETILNRMGLNGNECMLRTICEAADSPFDYLNGILGEVIHLVITPSSSRDNLLSHTYTKYYEAETLGRHGEPCEKIFKGCEYSIIDGFSESYNINSVI